MGDGRGGGLYQRVDRTEEGRTEMEIKRNERAPKNKESILETEMRFFSSFNTRPLS